jgi:hypothetical protein
MPKSESVLLHESLSVTLKIYIYTLESVCDLQPIFHNIHDSCPHKSNYTIQNSFIIYKKTTFIDPTIPCRLRLSLEIQLTRKFA